MECGWNNFTFIAALHAFRTPMSHPYPRPHSHHRPHPYLNIPGDRTCVLLVIGKAVLLYNNKRCCYKPTECTSEYETSLLTDYTQCIWLSLHYTTQNIATFNACLHFRRQVLPDLSWKVFTWFPHYIPIYWYDKMILNYSLFRKFVY